MEKRVEVREEVEKGKWRGKVSEKRKEDEEVKK